MAHPAWSRFHRYRGMLAAGGIWHLGRARPEAEVVTAARRSRARAALGPRHCPRLTAPSAPTRPVPPPPPPHRNMVLSMEALRYGRMMHDAMQRCGSGRPATKNHMQVTATLSARDSRGEEQEREREMDARSAKRGEPCGAASPESPGL